MNLHEGQRVVRGGTPLHTARAALILLHGRGASAEDIYMLGDQVAEDIPCVALIAPQAAGGAWYPQRFLAPTADNEPFLSSALRVIEGLVRELGQGGLPPRKVLVAGFSQGACLALEFASRNPCRYGGIVGLSGALIGPPGGVRETRGGLDSTPVYLGCSDRDAHIPLPFVEESARVLLAQGASVTQSIFPGMGHTVNDEEIAEFKGLLSAAAATP